IAPDDETVDPKWRGIGIRIEDDVVATQNGPLVLTAKVVKTVEDIEALMAKARAA
ncbi:MAG TPA: Xaa-Pro aminopeptidase, partial [Lysinibacillus sp.]|nr:Xaa-Pro aminopeptidase [Lysinibacillus sp.]